MKAKRKSVKNYIFISNALMVLIVIGICLLLIGFVIYEYDHRENNNLVEKVEVSSTSYQVSQLLESYDWSDISDDSSSLNQLSLQLNELGFTICVEEKGAILFSDIDNVTLEDLKDLEDYFSSDGDSHIYLMDGFTFITLQALEGSIRVYAISGEYSDFMATLKSLAMFVLVCIVIVVLFILILSAVSMFFAANLSNHIMKPLNMLIDASNEMKNGDYSKPISYQGDWEFEDVCQSFNEMQLNVREADQKKAEYEKARMDMIVGISHDLRTPLTAIRGTIKGLQDGVVNTPELQEKFLDTAYRRTLEMDKLLEQLFYFSKIETGNIPVNLEIIEWNKFLQDYKEKLETNDIASEVKCFIYGTEERLCSQIDSLQMERILDNIVENSRKYANVESLVISFHLYYKDGNVFLLVADNGQGVSEEKLPYIFDAFYRGDDSRNETEGNGLGLHIVKSLVEAMGGSVEAQNRQGLEVKMAFPIVKEKRYE